VAAGLALFIIVDPSRWAGIGNRVINGAIFGTMFSFVTLAAAWVPLGSVTLRARILRSLAMLAGLLAAIVTAATLIRSARGNPVDWQTIGIMGGMLAIAILGQWVLAQLPLWGLVWGYNVRVARVGRGGTPSSRIGSQFGIRELMTVTAGVAIVLGLGRAAVLTIVESELVQQWPMLKSLSVVIFLAVASVFAVLPLCLAMLMPRGALSAAAVALLLCALATYAEIPLFQLIENRLAATQRDVWFFVGMNATQAAWILAFTGMLRLGGYRLTTASASGDSP
jgi:hypothetical protein